MVWLLILVWLALTAMMPPVGAAIGVLFLYLRFPAFMLGATFLIAGALALGILAL